MKNTDKEIIREDLEFIADYIWMLAEKHPELKTEIDIFRKIDRRMDDILRRVDA